MHGIRLEEVLELFPPNSTLLLTGEQNLTHLVTGVTLIETPDIGNWVKGGELLLTTGYIYKDNPEQLLEVIKQLHQKKAAALGIKLNRYLDSLPDKVLKTAKRLGFPIFSILTEKPTFLEIISKFYKRLEESKALRHIQDKLLDNFLKEILLGNPNLKREMIKEGADLHNIPLNTPKAVFLLQGNNWQKDRLSEYKKLCLEATGSELLTMYKANKLALVVEAPSPTASKEAALKLATSLQQYFQNSYLNKKLFIGLSRFYDLYKLHFALIEAEKSLTIGRTVWPQRRLFHYDEMGFYRLIVNQTELEELKAFYQDTLEPLESYDKNNQTSLIPTLVAFLKQNGNITLTAQELFVHYNTVKYRITQIEEILKVNLKDAETRFNLQVALKIRQLLSG